MLYVPILFNSNLSDVLQCVYAVDRKAILNTFDALLQLAVLMFEKQPVVRDFVTQRHNQTAVWLSC